MKKFIFLISLIIISNIGHAQTKSGTIIYEVMTESKDSTLGVQTDKNMFPGSFLRIDFTENKTRIQFELSQGFILTNIVDLEKDKGLKTFQSEKGNFAIPCSAKEAKMSFENEEEVAIELTKEKKKILNYKCKKAIVNNEGVKTEYWYTEDLSIDFSGQKILTTKLPGFPLCFTTNSDGVETTFIAVKFVPEITDPTIFSLEIPEGYIVNEKGF